jgi:hypothetical protein
MTAAEATAGAGTTARVITAKVLADKIAEAIASLVNSSPATLDTLSELATALGNDPNFATTMATALGNKLDKAGGVVTGDLTVNGTFTADVTGNAATATSATWANNVASYKMSNLTKGTNPSSTIWPHSWIRYDSAGTAGANRITELRSFVDTSGRVGNELLAYDFASGRTASAVLGVYKEKGGATYGKAPTPDVSDNSIKIATTAWVRTATGNTNLNAATATSASCMDNVDLSANYAQGDVVFVNELNPSSCLVCVSVPGGSTP